MAWWTARWRIARSASGETARWAAAELLCAALTWLTLLWAGVVVVAGSMGVSLSAAAAGPWLTVSLAGALGYGTNFLAVRMLFRPLEPARPPLGWFWRQGLVPARQAELADRVGEAVDGRLLTPEKLAGAVSDAVAAPHVMDGLIEELRDVLWQQGELGDALADAVATSLSTPEGRTKVISALDDMMASRLKEDASAEAVARALRRWLAAESKLVMRLLRRVVRRTGKTSRVVEWAERSLVDWDELEGLFRKELRRRKGEAWSRDLVRGLEPFLHELLEGLVSDNALGSLMKRDASGEALWDTPEIKAALVEVSGPRLQEEVAHWIREGGLTEVLATIDVRGLVRDAAMAMPPEEIEALAEDVAARHLGAIQVLGYALGLIAGGWLVWLDQVTST